MNTAKKDLYWVIAFAVLALIAIITFWLGGKGNEIVSYISFASAIVSIVLAVVAIIYSIVQNVNSQQNIGEMRTLVSEASRLMTEKADAMEDQAMLIGESLRQFTETSTKVSGPSTPLEDEKFIFDASHSSIPLLLTFYYVAKCNELKKPMKLMSLSELILNPEDVERVSIQEKLQLKLQMYFYGAAGLDCLKCFWGFDGILFQKGSVKIEKIPTGFKENILKIITSRVQDSRREPSEKMYLEIGMKKIDTHVEAT